MRELAVGGGGRKIVGTAVEVVEGDGGGGGRKIDGRGLVTDPVLVIVTTAAGTSLSSE